MKITFKTGVSRRLDNGTKIPLYENGKSYDVPEIKARDYISKGWAIPALKLLTRRPQSENMPRKSLKFLRNQELNNATNALINLTPSNYYGTQYSKHGEEVSKLLKTLGLTPNPQPKITLPVQDPATVKRLKNKQMAKDIRMFFNNKDIQVKDLVRMLSMLLDYGVDIKDDSLISRVANDLLTLKRLTDYFYEEK
jgi:hypothetical protein